MSEVSEILNELGMDINELVDMAIAKKNGRLVEVVRCGECRKMMTPDCYMCGFDINGFCTSGPDDDQYCSFGERRSGNE
jgi:uncharacterized Fe-S cluster-containing MiaB family protein